MGRTLWLLRHAKAVEHPPPGGRDRDRRLSPRGERDADALCQSLSSGELEVAVPDYVIASPAARTLATAKRAFHALEPPIPIATDQRLYHATPDDVLEIIRELPDDVESACIVGHNPTIQCLSLDLVAEQLRDEPHPGASRYPPGTLSILEIPIARWQECTWGEGALTVFRIPPREGRDGEAP
jgi:phosphohistidine phosphatase